MTQRTVTHATFTIERHYDATPAQVFAAWADPDAKRRWFGQSEGWTTTEYELDFRIGGGERFRGRPEDGPVITYDAVFQDIVEGERIVYSYVMTSDGQRISVSVATVEIAAAGDGARLVFTEQGAFLDGLETAASREGGTGSLLDALAAELG
jgi:uncharacterized protein YndB with AHSA1/START domain